MDHVNTRNTSSIISETGRNGFDLYDFASKQYFVMMSIIFTSSQNHFCVMVSY